MGKLMDWINKSDEEDQVEQVKPKTSLYEQPISKDASDAVKKLGQVDSNLQLLEPRGYSDRVAIAKCLTDNKGVVVNLHRLNKEQKTRVFDFLCGVVFAIDGDLKTLSNDTYIFTPKNIGLDGSMTFDEDEAD